METSDQRPATPARSGRVMRVVLVLSLALNLLVVGMMAGAVYRFGPGIEAGMRSGEYTGHSASDLRALWWALPDDARRELRATVRTLEGDSTRPTREERRARVAARDEAILALLRSEPFDASAFARAIDAERSDRAERIDRAHEAFVARVVALSAAERAAMAERLENGRSRPARR